VRLDEMKAQPAFMPPTDSPGRSEPNPRAEPREASKPDGQDTEYRERDQRCNGAHHELHSAEGRPIKREAVGIGTSSRRQNRGVLNAQATSWRYA
jgi:hypothetical protein